MIGAKVPRLMRHSDASDLTPGEPTDPLAAIQQRMLELIVNEAELGVVLGELCKGVDALDPDLISTIMVVDPDGERLWPVAGPRAAPSALTVLRSPWPRGRLRPQGLAAFEKGVMRRYAPPPAVLTLRTLT